MKYLLVFLSVLLISSGAWAQIKKVYEYTGEVQEYVVPAGVTSIKVDLVGAGGGYGSWENARYEDKYAPGKGGSISAIYPVKPGEIVYVFVGGKGDNATDKRQGEGGFNGGGDGNNTGEYGPYCGGGGGGASDIRIGGKDLSNRVLIAGGAGGAGSNYPDGGDHGGDGGDVFGKNGLSENRSDDPSVGAGGTQKEGGKGGLWPSYTKAEDGKLGFGGNAPDSTSGGGGGGGYYGGGAGCWSGGGGGSSYSDPKATEVKHTQGVNPGHGRVTIVPACETPEVIVSGPTTICHGEEITLTGKSKYGAKLTWNNKVVNGVPFKPNLGANTYTMISNHSKECAYTIDIFAKPGKPVIVASKLAVCEGEEVTLEVEDMTGVVWDNGIQQGEPFIPPVGENKYKVTRTGECAGEDEIIITVNKVQIESKVTQIANGKPGKIWIKPSGGFAPYTYQWMDGNVEISIEKDVDKLKPGTYTINIKDNIGCPYTEQFTIDDGVIIEEIEEVGPKIKADLSQDEAFVTVSYPGAFEYKIENEEGETVITGHSVDSDLVEITRLKPGTYRVSLIYKQIKQYTTFVKN